MVSQPGRSPRPSVAEQVFQALYQQVLTLELPPGARTSEVEVAKAMGVSRQPVRDAFYRLSKLGFLEIRPQRGTHVTLISTEAVLQARYVRAALEIETIRQAADRFGPGDIAALSRLLEDQRRAIDAGDRPGFHVLDDRFHHEICRRAGVGFVWDLVGEYKGHMDRVRMLSLSFAAEEAFADHQRMVDGLRRNDPDASAEAMRTHLSRITGQIGRIRDQHPDLFADEPDHDHSASPIADLPEK